MSSGRAGVAALQQRLEWSSVAGVAVGRVPAAAWRTL